MIDPYRDRLRSCPACQQPLREFRDRLLCDACEGMFLSIEDLGAAVHDMTSVVPVFEYKDEEPGKRPCPRCSAAMTVLKLRLAIEGEVFKPKPQLDRCAMHGIWFDKEELASVLEKVASKGFGGGVGRKIGDVSKGHRAVEHGWSAVFKKFGGRGGW